MNILDSLRLNQGAAKHLVEDAEGERRQLCSWTHHHCSVGVNRQVWNGFTGPHGSPVKTETHAHQFLASCSSPPPRRSSQVVQWNQQRRYVPLTVAVLDGSEPLYTHNTGGDMSLLHSERKTENPQRRADRRGERRLKPCSVRAPFQRTRAWRLRRCGEQLTSVWT